MTALLIVDVQNDFLPGGALAVPHGDEIVAYINQKMKDYKHVVAVRDWHPKSHGSFASTHGKRAGEFVQLAGVTQVLWPVHCVQDSFGAEFAPGLKTERFDLVVEKGTDPEVDSYSGFFDNGRKKITPLHAELQKLKITSLVVCGLATDYCVLYTVLDALELGYRVTVLTHGCRGIDLEFGDSERAFHKMQEMGATVA